MKHALSLLSILLAAASLQAEETQRAQAMFWFTNASSAALMRYDYTFNTSGSISGGTLVTGGETLRVVFTSSTADVPFTIDAAGQLIPEGDTVAVWGKLAYPGESTYTHDSIAVGADTAGAPSDSVHTVGAQDTYYVGAAAFVDETIDLFYANTYYVYLVLLDTRESLYGDTTVGGSRVARVAIAGGAAAAEVGQTTFQVGYTIHTSYVTLDPPGADTSTGTDTWQATEAIASLTVGDTTYTGDELTTYLTPAISAMETDENGNLVLTASSTDAMFYGLETTDSLSGEWVTFEQFLTNCATEGKISLDTNEEKYYSRLRLNEGGSSVTLPVIDGDTSRFYRFSSGD